LGFARYRFFANLRAAVDSVRLRDRSLAFCRVRPRNRQQDGAIFERLQIVLESAINHKQMTARKINCLLGQL